MNKYEVILMTTKLEKVGEHYETIVNTTQKFVFDEYDDVQNLLGYMIEGCPGTITFKVMKIKEEE